MNHDMALNKNKIGLFASWGEYDFAYNANINYGMDYLFGGPTAFASRVAASTAAANATKVVFDNTRTQLNTLAALQAAAAGKRRKRLVDLNSLVQSVNSVFEASRAMSLGNPRVGGNGKQINQRYELVLPLVSVTYIYFCNNSFSSQN